ncbi:nucleotide exchange factor GrpE [Streptomyces sp. NPDC001068]|uniref:nucleotide exchange factor GrpE n=1 Tax=Streptomyces sp. NPDC001068 TaxID=3364544 RepID=UPI0036B5CFF1
MVDIVLCVVGALVGFLAGYLVRGPRTPVRDRPAPTAGESPAQERDAAPGSAVSPPPGSAVPPQPRRPQRAKLPEHTELPEQTELPEGIDRPEDAGPPEDVELPAGQTAGPASGDALRAAAEVLDVADLVTNQELSRRLAEAVVLLPGVSAIRPLRGEAFEPPEHEWVGSRGTEDSSRWDTVAEVRSPGASASGRVLRAAYVVVFEPPEES